MRPSVFEVVHLEIVIGITEVDSMVVTILSLLLNGIVLGLVLSSVAMGFSLFVGLCNVINFAHGAMYAFGAYFFLVFKEVLGFWPTIAITPILVGLGGCIIERGFVRRVVGMDPLFGLLLTFGLYIALEEIIRMIFGPAAYTVGAPGFADGVFVIGDLLYSKYRIFIALLAAGVLAGVWILASRTNIGAIVKAGMFDSEMVAALGHRLPALRTLVFGVGAGLAGFSGIVAAPVWGIKSSMGVDILFPSFAIVLLGGIGSIPGTIIGGQIVGISLSLGTLFFPRFVDIIPFLVMGVIIFFRPRGLFGEQHILEG